MGNLLGRRKPCSEPHCWKESLVVCTKNRAKYSEVLKHVFYAYTLLGPSACEGGAPHCSTLAGDPTGLPPHFLPHMLTFSITASHPAAHTSFCVISLSLSSHAPWLLL